MVLWLCFLLLLQTSGFFLRFFSTPINPIVIFAVLFFIYFLQSTRYIGVLERRVVPSTTDSESPVNRAYHKLAEACLLDKVLRDFLQAATTSGRNLRAIDVGAVRYNFICLFLLLLLLLFRFLCFSSSSFFLSPSSCWHSFSLSLFSLFLSLSLSLSISISFFLSVTDEIFLNAFLFFKYLFFFIISQFR